MLIYSSWRLEGLRAANPGVYTEIALFKSVVGLQFEMSIN